MLQESGDSFAGRWSDRTCVCVKWTKLSTDYSRRLILELDCGVKTKASNTILVSEVSAFRARG